MTTLVGQALTDEQREVVAKVEKLLRLAGKSTSEAEAASAAAKAAELMASYNLTSAAVGSGDDSGARAKEALDHGGYDFEYDLMVRVADLNFCLAWQQEYWAKRPANQLNHARTKARSAWLQTHVRKRKFELVGRPANVAATLATYDYLRGAIERLVREYISDGSRDAEFAAASGEERIVGLGSLLRSRRAHSFRAGAASRICRTLYERRREAMEREEAEAAELRAAADEAVAKRGEALPSSRALTLTSYSQAERDANMDALNGEGWSARQRADRERRAAAARAAEEEYTRWAAAHPEEARKQEEERRKAARETSGRARGPGSRGGRGRQREYDEAAYSAGYSRGKDVGVDPQSSTSARGRGLRAPPAGLLA